MEKGNRNLSIFSFNMKKFIWHIFIFSVVVLGTVVSVLSLADGYSDSFYLKLSSPKKTNLVLGTSKAAQGVQPDVLKKILKKDFYNYAFAIYSSPYGEVYLNSIKQKLDTTEKENTFILTIDAWSICSVNDDPNNSSLFRENKSYLKEVTNVNQKPNFKYLINYFEGGYYNILFNNQSVTFLHDNGWLEVSLDDKGNQRRTEFTLKGYQEKIKDYHYSKTRFLSVLETISYLTQYGKVYLVRLPVHPDLKLIEDEVMPQFDQTIQPAKERVNGYLDLSLLHKDLSYTDGVHLNKISGKQVSEVIANWINDLE